MNANDSTSQGGITARLVADGSRSNTLPQHFGPAFLFVENLVFDLASTLIPAYRGAYWHFYELSNGGFYMAPEMQPARLHVEGNGFEDVMSADAVGIVVCLFAFSHGSFSLSGQTGEICARHYAWLREFSLSHRERSLISAAID